MKLLTINCHSWQEDNQMEKIQTLANTIHENQYDVIALQEVSQKEDAPIMHKPIKEGNYAAVVVEKLHELGSKQYQFFWDCAHMAFDVYEEGIAIITKHPIEQIKTHVLTKSNDVRFWKTRIGLQADILIQDKFYSFFSCHLGWWHDEEEPAKYQMDQLMHAVNKDHHVFLMGDFNNEAQKRAEGYDYLTSNGWHDTYTLAEEKDEGTTVSGNIAGWETNKSDKRIDFIFTNCENGVRLSNVIFNGRNKAIISDHYGVEVIIDSKS
ncbi:endonuclease/exonuclease/phosphatase family protein [Gracilibacillus sp. YIM 98692]|uniref:endonuclease/exonuclease/phosphatase family protein n=1 Tax=Gracilibacillus sp. YIM 98692 TaxID=2663532 RepID=UPI0013D3CF3B|nr:endonuclease/exonuclease/phosphatase family protein [Gracilibacillus sp. YIM 98692]